MNTDFILIYSKCYHLANPKVFYDYEPVPHSSVYSGSSTLLQHVVDCKQVKLFKEFFIIQNVQVMKLLRNDAGAHKINIFNFKFLRQFQILIVFFFFFFFFHIGNFYNVNTLLI